MDFIMHCNSTWLIAHENSVKEEESPPDERAALKVSAPRHRTLDSSPPSGSLTHQFQIVAGCLSMAARVKRSELLYPPGTA